MFLQLLTDHLGLGKQILEESSSFWKKWAIGSTGLLAVLAVALYKEKVKAKNLKAELLRDTKEREELEFHIRGAEETWQIYHRERSAAIDTEMRLASISTNSKIITPICNGKGNDQALIVSSWKYSDLRDMINTNPETELREACK